MAVNLSDLQIRMREREPHEWSDLGIAFWRRHWRAVSGAWNIATGLWTLFCLGLLVTLSQFGWLNRGTLFLVTLMFWWMLPIFERLVTAAASESVFNHRRPAGERVRGILREQQGWFWFLTIGRFAPGRAFSYPFYQLEGLKRNRRAERMSLLVNETGNRHWVVGIWYAHVELLLAFSLLQLLHLAQPAERYTSFSEILEHVADARALPMLTLSESLLTLGAYAAAVLLVRPVYVCCCFMVYLGGRITLEAWDIQIAFSNLRDRLQQKEIRNRRRDGRGGTGRTIGALLIASLLAVQPQTGAQEEAGEPASRAIDTIMDRPEFEYQRTRQVPADAEDDEREKEQAARDLDFDANADIGGAAAMFAGLLKIMLVIILIGLLAWIVWFIIRYADRLKAGGRSHNKQPREKPTTVAGFDLKQDTLPDQPADVALALIAEGRMREAMALLYVACLKQLIYVEDLDIVDGATEGDCERAASRLSDCGMATFLMQLTPDWIRIAYDHQKIGAEVAIRHANTFARHWDPTVEARGRRS